MDPPALHDALPISQGRRSTRRGRRYSRLAEVGPWTREVCQRREQPGGTGQSDLRDRLQIPVTQADSKAACQAFKNTVKLPPVGSHVAITGSWVKDMDHNGWLEIHPVTSIVVIQE